MQTSPSSVGLPPDTQKFLKFAGNVLNCKLTEVFESSNLTHGLLSNTYSEKEILPNVIPL